MEILNAIAKVRFNSARPQRVQLHKTPGVICDLLCLEPKQELPTTGKCAYYVVAGTGLLKAGRHSQQLSLGNFATTDQDEHHIIFNSSEQRLICLAISAA